MAVTTNTRKLAALLGASGAGIGTDGLLQSAGIDTDMATQAELDAIETDANKTQSNLAILAIRQAADHNDVKYSLQDRIIDTYYDASGVDVGPSTNHSLTSGVYSGVGTSSPTITHDADATGVDGDYTWYKWTDTAATGSYSTNTAQDYDFLVIAGGGGGGGSVPNESGLGGGGAGGYRNSFASEATGGGGSNEAALAIGTAPTYTITVGAGGTGHPAGSNGVGGSGGVSSIVGSDITDITTVGGGGGAGSSLNGYVGGSGGGQGYNGQGGAGTANQGYAGAGGQNVGVPYAGSGGGGAGGAGNLNAGNSTGGAGGIGLSSSIDGTATNRGGGGGASGSYNGSGTAGAGGIGGGGAGSDPGTGVAGTANTGGGGGGGGPVTGTGGTGGNGGTGIVILRRLTGIPTPYADLILQSTDTTAETEADYADMVMLIEDSGGTPAVVNTDVKGHISEDSGVTFTEGVLVDEGDWGTNKRILAFHDLDISAQSGTAMCYKITTHNQSSSKETKIHATSIGWR